MTPRDIQAAVARVDLWLCTVWAYIRAAPWALAAAAGLWWAAWIKYRKQKRGH